MIHLTLNGSTMRILLFVLLGLFAENCYCQDSTAATYIHQLIQKIEGRITTDILERKDTTIFDNGDSLYKGPFLTVRTEFYTDPQTMQLDKVVERSLYRKVSTELTVYFFGDQPICFTNKQWEDKTIRMDFDVYYKNDNSVFTVKRTGLKGIPDGKTYLKWCYEFKTEYLRMVQDYNQTFARNKVKLR